MNPQMVTSIAYIVAELASSGMSIASMLQEAKATGKIPPETWAEIMAEIKSAEELWENS